MLTQSAFVPFLLLDLNQNYWSDYLKNVSFTDSKNQYILKDSENARRSIDCDFKTSH